MTERGKVVDRTSGRRGLALRLGGALALAALLAALAGCGVTTGLGGEQGISASPGATGTTGAASASPIVAATKTATSSSATPCPASDQGPGNPALILTPATPNRSGAAHVGDMVQVRLPTTTKWSFTSAQPTGTLTATQPSGALIHSVNACVWSFHAAAAGTATLSFIGQALCEPGKPCPNYRLAMNFTVTVS